MARLTLLTVILFIIGFSSCRSNIIDPALTEPGVSRSLADFRKEKYENIRYELFFSIPDNRQTGITGNITLFVDIEKKLSLIIDFRASGEQINEVLLNGEVVPYRFENEHIIISGEEVLEGKNRIDIDFLCSDQSLNRRDEFLYTLLVPDRARTLFPCFDQPNLKANYTLNLEIPEDWKAVANSPVDTVDTTFTKGRHRITFKETEPLSTYLFSFVAGKLIPQTFSRGEREIILFHRETDPQKIAQCPEIADEVFDALEWLENYTGIPYPFAKYDLIILPGFQYGGMEHTGATLYNDRRMFLNENPTLDERLNRSALIAHETAHMWFGDYVTMDWFDDVWTKEVFANYFASLIVEPLYPDVDHRLNFISDYVPATYAEDRTIGSNPVKQELDNLNNAGLVYGNIIYNKSPVIMEMLVQKIGEENFRKGIQEYLQTYAYSNADWEGLIRILSQYTTDDLENWSRVWIHEKGMPEIETAWNNGQLQITQKDSWQRRINWPQQIKFTLLSPAQTEEITVEMTSSPAPITVHTKTESDSCVVIPNSDGRGYGFFRMSAEDIRKSTEWLRSYPDNVFKGSLLINWYENLLHGTIDPEWYIETILNYAGKEENDLLFSMAMSQLGGCLRVYPSCIPETENGVWELVTGKADPSHRLQAFRLYRSIASTLEAAERLYAIWKNRESPAGITLSENDFIQLSWILALLNPDKADEIISQQAERISNPDRQNEYRFIAPSVSSRKSVRDSVFTSLLQAENRRIEPWASTALSLLNHRLRQQEAVSYIRSGLDILEEVQRTGDIFFPTAWTRALLSGHTSPEARQEVEHFFQENPDFSPMLSNKIKQQADFLYRSTN